MTIISDFVTELNEHLGSSGMTQIELSSKVGVSQSQISDWKNGKIRQMSPHAVKTKQFIENYRSSKIAIPDVIEQAIAKTWDGTEEGAEAIAHVVEALSVFSRAELNQMNE